MNIQTKTKLFDTDKDIYINSNFWKRHMDVPKISMQLDKHLILNEVMQDNSHVYPVALGVAKINDSAHKVLQEKFKVIYKALHKIISEYYKDNVLREFLNIPEGIKKYVDLDSNNTHHIIDICRFDLIGEDVNNLKIIEFNANCPAGAFYSGIIQRIWRQIPPFSDFIQSWDLKTNFFEKDNWFIEFMEKTLDKKGFSLTNNIDIIYQKGGNISELKKMYQQIIHNGFHAKFYNPSEIETVNSNIKFAYLKVRLQDALQDAEKWKVLWENIIEERLIVPNMLGARWIGDNKGCLAIMSDPRFNYLFNEKEIHTINSMIPWTRMIGDGVDEKFLIENKDDLVIKGIYDTRGNSIYIGLDYSKDEWTSLIKYRIKKRKYVAQKYYPIPIVNYRDGEYLRDLSATILHGKIAGFRSRLSKNLKVNIAQGGESFTVFS